MRKISVLTCLCLKSLCGGWWQLESEFSNRLSLEPTLGQAEQNVQQLLACGVASL